MASVINSICLILAIATSTKATSCNFQYIVPGTSPSICESRGGVDSVVVNKIDNLKGQLEGIKITEGINGDLIKILRDNLDQANRQHEFAKSQLENLQKEIDNIKSIVKVVSDEEADEKETADDATFNPLIESNRILKNAIKEAEMKIFNMTRFLQETSRRRSIMTNVLESRLLQQRQQIDDGLKKVQDMERTILIGSPIKRTAFQTQQDEFIFNLTSQTIDLLVKAAAAKEVGIARYSDLEFDVRDMEEKLKKESKKMDSLRQDNANLIAVAGSIASDIQSVNNTLNVLENNLIPRFNRIVSEIPDIQTKTNKLFKDLSDLASRIMTMSTDEQNVTQTLSKAQVQIGQLVTEVATLLANLTGQESKLKNIKKDPLIVLEEILNMAESNYLKEKPLIEQMVNTVHGLNTTINGLRSPPTPQTGSANVTPGHTPRKRLLRKQLLCGSI